jgi:phenylacetic acid degradation operon negative regulatory protein
LQVRESWILEELTTHYSEFIQLFLPLWKTLREQDHWQGRGEYLSQHLSLFQIKRIT